MQKRGKRVLIKIINEYSNEEIAKIIREVLEESRIQCAIGEESIKFDKLPGVIEIKKSKN